MKPSEIQSRPLPIGLTRRRFIAGVAAVGGMMAYFNAGPMRISHHHHTTLAYCRELQVPLEVFVPDGETAYVVQVRRPLAGRRVRRREVRADFDGYISELLSKAITRN